jgi:hypothetical protein
MAKERVKRSTIVLNRLTNVVGTSATRIVPNDPKRLALLLVNTGASALWVGFSQSVAPGASILLGPYGGSLTMTLEEDHETVYYEIWGVAEGAPTTIACLEVISLED